MERIRRRAPFAIAAVAVIALAAAALAAVLIWPLAAGAAPAARTPTPKATAVPACDSARTVQVTGAATVNVIPDRALVRLGVQSNATTVDAVEAANTAAIQRVLQALDGQGIDAADISTDIYVVRPIYSSYESLVIKGYRIDNEVAITLRDAQQTSAVISAALKAGANQVNDVAFYTSELRKYRDQARDLAVTAAREKAQALAAAAGAEAGCVITITENTWSYYSGWWYGRDQSLMSQNVVQNLATGQGTMPEADEPIALGKIAVKAEVSATFGLR